MNPFAPIWLFVGMGLCFLLLMPGSILTFFGALTVAVIATHSIVEVSKG